MKRLKKSGFRDFRSKIFLILRRSRLNFLKTCRDSKKMTLPTSRFGIFMDKVKNFYDHSIILDQWVDSTPPPSGLLGLINYLGLWAYEKSCCYEKSTLGTTSTEASINTDSFIQLILKPQTSCQKSIVFAYLKGFIKKMWLKNDQLQVFYLNIFVIQWNFLTHIC